MLKHQLAGNILQLMDAGMQFLVKKVLYGKDHTKKTVFGQCFAGYQYCTPINQWRTLYEALEALASLFQHED